MASKKRERIERRKIDERIERQAVKDSVSRLWRPSTGARRRGARLGVTGKPQINTQSSEAPATFCPDTIEIWLVTPCGRSACHIKPKVRFVATMPDTILLLRLKPIRGATVHICKLLTS
jgi:hypothetical protein